MGKRILVTGEQFEYIVKFIGESKDLEEQDNKFKVGDITGSIGTTKNINKKSKEEVESDESSEDDKELAILFHDKFVKDIGKVSYFKNLSTNLKQLLMQSWFNEGGLPKDFFENADKYTFKIFRAGKPIWGKVVGNFDGDLGKERTELVEKTYETINLENINNYNGKSNTYSYINVYAPNTSKSGQPVFTSEGGLDIKQITLEGHQLFIMAPGIGTGDGAKISQTSSTPDTKETFTVDIPPIPVSFATGVDTLSPGAVTDLKDKLFNYFNNNEKIKYVIENGLDFEISNINVTSSASNSWNNNTVPYTNEPGGGKVKIPYQQQFDNSNPTIQRYSTSNLTLSQNRGRNFENLLKTDPDLKNTLKIGEDTTFNSDGIVTNTNGLVDDDPRRQANAPIGQFAKFTFTVKYKKVLPGKNLQTVNLNNFIIKLIKNVSEGGNPFTRFFDTRKAKYIKGGGGFKSSRAIGRNVGKHFSGFKLF